MPDARGRGFYLSNGAEVSRSIAEDGLAPPLRAVLTEEEEGAPVSYTHLTLPTTAEV